MRLIMIDKNGLDAIKAKFSDYIGQRGQIVYILLIFIYSLIGGMLVVSQGYMPGDDALRHSAKVISGKDWGDVLLLNDYNVGDVHQGWHSFLEMVNDAFSMNSTEALVTFSVLFLFVSASFIPALFVKRREVWILAVALFAIISPEYLRRILIGRPLVFSMTTLAVMLLTWRLFREKHTHWVYWSALIALLSFGIWIHPSWYLYALPIFAFVLARQFRAGIKLGVCVAVGAVAASLLSGDPVNFFQQQFYIMQNVAASHYDTTQLASELQPRIVNTVLFLCVVILVVFRHIQKRNMACLSTDPVFTLMIVCALLGQLVARFWIDWGMVAALVWIACELTEVFEKWIDRQPLKAFTCVCFTFIFSFVSLTANFKGRWTHALKVSYPDLAKTEENKLSWFPGDGGVVYSDDMRVFYGMFYSNPHANWKYVLGFEPSFMPKEDLEIFRDIQWGEFHHLLYNPWITKMRPQDRLILTHEPSPFKPYYTQLEWEYLSRKHWVGRLKQPGAKAME